MTDRETTAGLQRIARQSMTQLGFEPDFPQAALAEVAAIAGPAPVDGPGVRDLRALPWCSIDNDDSRDLDQLTAAEPLPTGAVKVYVAIADVDALVRRGSALDGHAERNAASVYTAAQVFPMLPERLSTDLTSLGEGVDRLAVVMELVVNPDGTLRGSEVYRAAVHNRAKLAYDGVSAWLEDRGPLPERARAPGMAEQLRLQNGVAQKLRALRFEHGALDFEIRQPKITTTEAGTSEVREEKKGPARLLIEDLMIAANGATARFLESRGLPVLRRVVREPRRWDRIVALAADLRTTLPAAPDAKALEAFLESRRRADPAGFSDLSLAVVKLLGAGEYVAELPGQPVLGHFGLAVRDYSHSTAPNRRFPDLIVQRLLKAAAAGATAPYPASELARLAAHCTAQENAASKVERRVLKSAAALTMRRRIGEAFAAMVTGASEKGTWVRLNAPPIEGKLVSDTRGADVGDRLTARLVAVDVERGFIDFERV